MAGNRLEEAVARALGGAVQSSCAVAGGDINNANQMTLADGRVVFVKSNFGAEPTMFAAEARGLAWLAQARALRVPEVLAVGETFLVLEPISAARRRPDFDEKLGRDLAALHRRAAELRPRSRQLHRAPAPVQRTRAELAGLLPHPQAGTAASPGARCRPVQFGHGPRIRPPLHRAG